VNKEAIRELNVKKPVGLRLVQLVTIIISITFIMLIGTLMALSNFYGVPFAGWSWFLLGMLGFLLTIILFSNKLSVWYAANGYWITFFLFFFYLGITQDSAFGIIWGKTWLIMFPLVYSFGSIQYFQTRRVKEYFHLIKTHRCILITV
jgi:hypothetical protein